MPLRADRVSIHRSFKNMSVRSLEMFSRKHFQAPGEVRAAERKLAVALREHIQKHSCNH
jgi:hypothetical protein